MGTRRWVEPVVLEGEIVRLEPLGPEHLAGLADVAFDPTIWRYIPARVRDRADLERWLVTALAARDAGTELPFATIDRASGRPIGSTRYLAIVPEHRRLEIGWTWLTPERQRSGANRETKLLLLRHAFEALDPPANRVEFKTDSRNEASRAALLGIGATFEGIHRNHMVMPEGPLRHSAWYSIIAEEWPEARAALEGRIRR